MRKLSLLVAAGFLALGASVAQAQTPFNATLTIAVGNFAPLSFAFTGTGNSNGMTGEFEMLTNDAAAAVAVPIDPPILGALAGLAVCESGLATGTTMVTLPAVGGSPILSCAPGGGPGGINNVVFDGTTGVGALDATAYLTGLPDGAGLAALQVPIPLGVVGAGGVENFLILGFLPGTLTGQTWSLGMVTGTGILAGVPIPPIIETGFDNRDGAGLGSIKLTTLAQACLGAGCSVGDVPAVATLTLTFIPEPGTVLLLGMGIAGLATFGRRRAA